MAKLMAESRFTRFVASKNRVARLQQELSYWRWIEGDTGVKTERILRQLQEEIDQISLMTESFYRVLSHAKTERMRHVAELRYMDGWAWKDIATATGLTLSRLYQINWDIQILYAEYGCQELVSQN